MGYSNLDQVTAGIHQRLWCRTFILANTLTGPRIVLVTLDTQAGSQIMKLEVPGVNYSYVAYYISIYTGGKKTEGYLWELVQ